MSEEKSHQQAVEWQLGRNLVDLYQQTPFGKVAKSEVEWRVFAAYSRIVFEKDPKLWKDGRFIWIRLEPSHLRKLSLDLRISELRVASAVEQCALAEGAEELSTAEALNEIERLANLHHQDSKDLEAGKIRLFIPNRVVRKAIGAFLSRNGAIPDTSFNRDHLVIRIADLLIAASGNSEADFDGRMEYLLDQLVKQGRTERRKVESFSEKQASKSLMDKALALSKWVAPVLVDSVGTFGLSSLIALLGNEKG